MPICIKCNKNKKEIFFSYKNLKTKKRQNSCKECHRKYVKEHYKKNKEIYKKRAVDNSLYEKEKTKNLLKELKKKCELCNESWFEVLDFHHIDPDKKEKNISRLSSRKKIFEESKKCIVLCSNCHRKYHSKHEKTIALVDQLVESRSSNLLSV